MERLEEYKPLNNIMDKLVVLPIEGFTSIRTLRSASSASTTSPASINSGLTSLYFHTALVVGFGRGGTIFAISVHSGAKCFGGSDSRKAPPDLAVGVSKVVVVDIVSECGALLSMNYTGLF